MLRKSLIFSLGIILIFSSITISQEKALIALYDGTFGRKGEGDGEFIEPLGICTDTDGNLYVVDSGNCRVQVFDEEGEFVRSFGEFGWEEGKFLYPVDCAIDENLAIYVVDLDKGVVYKFSEDGNYQGQIIKKMESSSDKSTLEGVFNQPMGVEVGRSGELFVVNTANHKIDVFDRLNSPIDELGGFGSSGGFFNTPYDCSVSKRGLLYVADTLNNRIQVLNEDFLFISEIVGDEDKLNPMQIDTSPMGYCIVSDGNNNEVYIYDSSLDRVLTIDGEKVDGFNMPYGVAISDDYCIYISDRFNHRIVKYQLTEPPPEK